jgi:diketogulonate reductase-like aldo/keto reductase
MYTKELAKTGVMLPEIGFGTWEYHGGVEPLRKAVDLGASLIDTAEAYRTEEIVGEAIHGLRDHVFLATKVSSNHFRRGDLFQAVDASLRRLKTDYIDLYQLHWPSPTIPIEETISALEEIVQQGKVRFLGVCNFSAAQVARAQRALTKHKIVSNQVSYSLLQRTIEIRLLPYCEARDITVIAYSPLARGIANLRRKDARGALRSVAAATGKTEAQVALNFCTSRPSVIAIPKAASLAHVIEDCGASGWRLSPGELRLLEKNFRRRGPIELGLRGAVRTVLYRLKLWA